MNEYISCVVVNRSPLIDYQQAHPIRTGKNIYKYTFTLIDYCFAYKQNRNKMIQIGFYILF